MQIGENRPTMVRSGCASRIANTADRCARRRRIRAARSRTVSASSAKANAASTGTVVRRTPAAVPQIHKIHSPSEPGKAVRRLSGSRPGARLGSDSDSPAKPRTQSPGAARPLVLARRALKRPTDSELRAPAVRAGSPTSGAAIPACTHSRRPLSPVFASPATDSINPAATPPHHGKAGPANRGRLAVSRGANIGCIPESPPALRSVGNDQGSKSAAYGPTAAVRSVA